MDCKGRLRNNNNAVIPVDLMFINGKYERLLSQAAYIDEKDEAKS